MSADRSRRRTIVCAACQQTSVHRGHGWCVTCYQRWVYHGRPASGVPGVGATPRRPRRTRARAIPEYCARGHRLDAATLTFDTRGSRRCRACLAEADRAYRARQFAARHDGHDVIPTRDGRRYCRTCNRGAQDVDDVAVERTAAGDRPGRVAPAELEAAVTQLRRYGLTYELIAERTGCSLRHAWEICRQAGLTKPRVIDGDRPKRRRYTVCSSCGERRTHQAHGWCGTCYSRWLLHGKPATVPPPARRTTRAGAA
ncbi:hypothetical protein [Streptomyces sp. NPDC047315]|uniref:hypothetical protein n=1 Tax=unclassified Streptomyces TaxID=2593676 RepID=UPI0033E4CB87